MSTYCIGYNLKRPEKNYPDVTKALETYDTWWHQAGSTWIVVTSKTAAEVRAHILQATDTEDDMQVIKLNGFNMPTRGLRGLQAEH